MNRLSKWCAPRATTRRLRRSATVGLAGIALAGLTAGGAAGAAGIVAQASSQAIRLALLGGGVTFAASNPPTTATSDGSSNVVNQNSPAVTELSSENWLSVGALSELAAAHANGTSFACAGAVQSGGSLQIGAGSNCFAVGGSGAGVTINLTAIPGVTSALSGVASVVLHLSAITAYADATPSGAIGSAGLGAGVVDVTLAGGSVEPSVPINFSSAPNQNVLAEVISALNAQNNPQATATANALSSQLAPAVALISNYQTMTGGALSVTGLHVALVGGSGAVSDIANVVVGPNSTSGTSGGSGGGAPSVSGINPTSGPASGGTFVSITGSNLAGTTSVTFGGTPATFVANPDGSLTAVAPAGSGTVDVQAASPSGTSPSTAGDRYTYLSGTSGGSTSTAGTSGGATSSNSGLSGSAGSTGSCPAGERATGSAYALPFTLHMTYGKARPGTLVFARIVSGNTIILSNPVRLSAARMATIVDNRPASGALTGEVVLHKRIVAKAPIPPSVPVRCASVASGAGRTVTFIARLPQVPIGARLAGTVFSGSKAVLSFNVQIRSNHVATYLAHTTATGKLVAKLFKPGTQRRVALVSVAGLSL